MSVIAVIEQAVVIEKFLRQKSFGVARQSVEESFPNKDGYLTEDAGFADNVVITKRVGEKLVVDGVKSFKDGTRRASYHLTLNFTRRLTRNPFLRTHLGGGAESALRVNCLGGAYGFEPVAFFGNLGVSPICTASSSTAALQAS
jgi:hypothetical protein